MLSSSLLLLDDEVALALPPLTLFRLFRVLCEVDVGMVSILRVAGLRFLSP